MEDRKTTGKHQDVGRRLLQKALMPIVATAASAAATYAAKRAPQLIDEKILPKLRTAVDGAGSATQDLPSKAKSAASDAGDIVEKLGDKAKSVAGGVQRPASNGSRARSVSGDELARRTKARAEARAQRRKAGR